MFRLFLTYCTYGYIRLLTYHCWLALLIGSVIVKGHSVMLLWASCVCDRSITDRGPPPCCQSQMAVCQCKWQMVEALKPCNRNILNKHSPDFTLKTSFSVSSAPSLLLSLSRLEFRLLQWCCITLLTRSGWMCVYVCKCVYVYVCVCAYMQASCNFNATFYAERNGWWFRFILFIYFIYLFLPPCTNNSFPLMAT